MIRFDTRIEAETTEAFRIQAAGVAAICRNDCSHLQKMAIAAAAQEAGLPDWVHDWLAEYEARLIGWETPSRSKLVLVRWLQATIWEYAERRAARIRERLRAIAKATSSSSSSSRPA